MLPNCRHYGLALHLRRYSVTNAYLEEKEDTCNALGEIAENTGWVDHSLYCRVCIHWRGPTWQLPIVDSAGLTSCHI